MPAWIQASLSLLSLTMKSLCPGPVRTRSWNPDSAVFERDPHLTCCKCTAELQGSRESLEEKNSALQVLDSEGPQRAPETVDHFCLGPRATFACTFEVAFFVSAQRHEVRGAGLARLNGFGPNQTKIEFLES